MELKGLKRESFERWLELFFETVNDVFEERIAIKFQERSTLIAGNFMRNLQL
jgi:hemoglobin